MCCHRLVAGRCVDTDFGVTEPQEVTRLPALNDIDVPVSMVLVVCCCCAPLPAEIERLKALPQLPMTEDYLVTLWNPLEEGVISSLTPVSELEFTRQVEFLHHLPATWGAISLDDSFGSAGFASRRRLRCSSASPKCRSLSRFCIFQNIFQPSGKSNLRTAQC